LPLGHGGGAVVDLLAKHLTHTKGPAAGQPSELDP
jgi:hypothetical protein